MKDALVKFLDPDCIFRGTHRFFYSIDFMGNLIANMPIIFQFPVISIPDRNIEIAVSHLSISAI